MPRNKLRPALAFTSLQSQLIVGSVFGNHEKSELASYLYFDIIYLSHGNIVVTCLCFVKCLGYVMFIN